MSSNRGFAGLNVPGIAYVMGTLLLVTGGGLAFPALVAALYGESDLKPLAGCAIAYLASGLLLRRVFRVRPELSNRGAILIATLGWVIISAASAVPFMLHGAIPNFTDAFFEMMSGYTTTGATILNDIEAVPHGLLFWRSETHLLGGMGFITLAILFLPQGTGGRLFRAESSPGQVITGERFTARTRDAIAWLWGIYLGLNALQVVLLMMGRMSLFDALCHAFGTVSTSGYSTYNASVAAFDSAWVDWVTIVFMFLGGMTFLLFYAMLHRDWKTIRINTEFRWYVGIVLAFCLGVAGVLWTQGGYDAAPALRYGSFQVISLLTTTGFTTADYEQWPHAAQMMLWVVCFIGACAGSTTSGIKVVHFVVIIKYCVGAVKKLFLQPLSVVSVRLNGKRVPKDAIQLALAYFIANIFIVALGGIFMSAVDNLDYASALSSVISSLMNIGPGFGAVGPTHNYDPFSDVGKWFLAMTMLMGRLEMFSALVVFYPTFWRE